MLSNLMEQVRRMAGGGGDGAAIGHRRDSVDVAVAWWVVSLRNRDGIDQAALDGFGAALTTDLTQRLDKTYRVYLEVNHQPKGILRSVALESGLNVDAFPPGTTMSVSDTKVAVSTAALAPYEILHGREGDR
jgi:hypothetical protein